MVPSSKTKLTNLLYGWYAQTLTQIQNLFLHNLVYQLGALKENYNSCKIYNTKPGTQSVQSSENPNLNS